LRENTPLRVNAEQAPAFRPRVERFTLIPAFAEQYKIPQTILKNIVYSDIIVAFNFIRILSLRRY
jgi:hypothetical protein